MVTQNIPKFFFLESIDNFLLEAGFSNTWSDIITFIIALLTLLLLTWIIKIIVAKIVIAVVQTTIRRTEKKWDKYLLQRKFYDRIVRFGLAIVVMATTRTLFVGFSERIILMAETIIGIYLIYTGLQVFQSFMNTVNDVYETKPQARQKSIRSIIQSVNIVAAVVAVVLIISILLQQNPKDLLVALGASAAIVSLVFRDTILGFVASIQISSQEMIHPGDWIEMPTRNVNGAVMEINVMNVKVKNWDNSTAMIPAYAMITESFINWRSMQEGEGRRFLRPLRIDIHCVHNLSEKEIEKIMSHSAMSPELAGKMMEIMAEGNTSGAITNVGLYRSYLEAFIQQHPRIVESQRRVVRYLDNTEFGITLQIYAYSKDKDLHDYERVISDIMENAMMMAPVFGIKMYQVLMELNDNHSLIQKEDVVTTKS